MWARAVGKSLKLKSSERFVLRELGDQYREKTGVCDPAVSLIHSETGLERKTILKAIAVLESLNVIKKKAELGKRSEFVLNFDLDFELSTDAKNGTGQKEGCPESGTGSNAENGIGEFGTGAGFGTGTYPENGIRPVPNLAHKPTTTNSTNNTRGKLPEIEVLDWSLSQNAREMTKRIGGVPDDFVNHQLAEFMTFFNAPNYRFPRNKWDAKFHQQCVTNWKKYGHKWGAESEANQRESQQNSTGPDTGDWYDEEFESELAELAEHSGAKDCRPNID